MSLFANGENVKLGKGALLLDQIVGGLSTGLDFVGNASAISASADITKAEIYSSTEKTASLLASSISRALYKVTVTLNEYTLSNLRKFLLASSGTRAQAAATGTTKNFTGTAVAKNKFLDLESRNVTAVVVTYDGTELGIAGTDYQLYAEEGFIKVLKGGGIDDGEAVSVQFNTPAINFDQLSIATDSSPVCKLVYQADDSNNEGASARDRLVLWRVQVAPSGDLNLISDDYGSFQLEMSILSDAANHPAQPYGYLERIKV